MIVRTASLKRSLTLPKTLQNLDIRGAKFDEDTLRIRFGGKENE